MNIVTDKLIELLQDNLTSRGIRTFRIGNPVDVGKSQLPLIFVQGLEERVTSLDSANDIKEMDFQIGVIVDPAQTYGKTTAGIKETSGDRLLMEIISGRNSNNTPMTDSISYILRHNWTMDGVVFTQESRTVYGVREVLDAFYKEVHYFITAKASVSN